MSQLRVIFDLDDTLYPERAFAISGFRAAGAWADETFGVDGMAAEMERLFAEGHLGPLFKKALATHVPDHGDHHLEQLVETYRAHDPVIELFEDASWALKHYAAQGPLGLITDGTAQMQAGKVNALNIRHHFHHVILTDALGGKQFRKPHPESYEIMEQELAAEGVTFVYVGDNPAKDFVTPNKRGWISIQVRRPGGIHDPDKVAEGGAPQHLITSLRQLPEILGR
jgi:putative hydrolase of the HAD superfamily